MLATGSVYVVGSGVAGFNLGFHASRILCLDLDSSRTGAFGNEVDVVEVHLFLNTFRELFCAVSGADHELKEVRADDQKAPKKTEYLAHV